MDRKFTEESSHEALTVGVGPLRAKAGLDALLLLHLKKRALVNIFLYCKKLCTMFLEGNGFVTFILGAPYNPLNEECFATLRSS